MKKTCKKIDGNDDGSSGIGGNRITGIGRLLCGADCT